jgi:GABA permease
MALRVLALANETVTADELLDELRRVALNSPAGYPAQYFVCVPANPLDLGRAQTESGAQESARTVEDAQRRLDSTLNVLRSEGLKAEGSLGDSRPMYALQDAVTDFRPDLLIVATHPQEQSAWLSHHVVQEARQTHHLPVTHVISQAKTTIGR